ncbi:hypothetical protein D5086_027449 [Populus alba]|uniref:Uncharacterized protein n=1 Tax=Populus alba TaxID=43335 RepID=A0ACC4AVH6_POPAL
MDRKTPVRVIYKVKLKSSKTFSLKGTGWSKNLNPIFVYDGLYIVEELWEERGEFGKLVFKFKLKRNLDQTKLPQRLEKKLLLSRKFSDPELQVSRNEDEWANIKLE